MDLNIGACRASLGPAEQTVNCLVCSTPHPACNACQALATQRLPLHRNAPTSWSFLMGFPGIARSFGRLSGEIPQRGLWPQPKGIADYGAMASGCQLRVPLLCSVGPMKLGRLENGCLLEMIGVVARALSHHGDTHENCCKRFIWTRPRDSQWF